MTSPKFSFFQKLYKPSPHGVYLATKLAGHAFSFADRSHRSLTFSQTNLAVSSSLTGSRNIGQIELGELAAEGKRY